MAFFTKQLSDAKADYQIKSVSGACPNSADFVDLVNAVTERVMDIGNFWETEVIYKYCVRSCHVVWSRHVGTVLGTRFCKNDQTPIHNNHWAIVGTHSCGGFGPGISMRDGNTVPIYNEVSGNEGKLIRYYPVKNADIGKTITLYGTQFGGQPLQEFVGGVWRQGLTLTAAAPFGTTTVLVTKITAVTRQASSGLMYLYEYDAATDLMRDLAVYEPNEVSPRYRSSIIENACAIPYCTDANGVKTARLEALVKLEFQPLVNDNDFLLIDSFAALALGIQAIKLEQANDDDGALRKWMAAVAVLNQRTRNKQPELQTAILLNVFGQGSETMYNPI